MYIYISQIYVLAMACTFQQKTEDILPKMLHPNEGINKRIHHMK